MKRNFVVVSMGLLLLTSCKKGDFNPFCDGQFNKVYGGSQDEGAKSIFATPDGGYLFAGWAYSNDQDVSGNHGRSDVWLVKIACNGRIQWQKTFGGTGYDNLYSMMKTSDGNFVLCGETRSQDIDPLNYKGGAGDAWLVKIDPSGNQQLQKLFGGTDEEWLYSVIEGPNKKFITIGITFSNDKDVIGLHGYGDAWIMRF